MTMATIASRMIRATNSARVVGESIRNISVGTSMLSSDITLQKARPWFMDDSEGSNMAADNAVTTKEIFDGKTVAIFGVPAPFTGTCTEAHYPPYKALTEKFYEGGVDKIVCYAVADPYCHYNWAKSMGNDFDKIEFMADEDASFAKAFDLDAVYDAVSLGQRSKRFSMIVSDGKVKSFNIVEDADKDAETLLSQL